MSLSIEVIDSTGRAVGVEFRVKLDYVEIWCRGHCAAVLDREVVADWLTEPFRELTVDEVTLRLDHKLDIRGRVAITLPDVNDWALSPNEEARLHAIIMGGH